MSETEKHVHNLGHGNTCACGWVMKVPRYSFSIDICDGNETIATDGYSSDSLVTIIMDLQRLIERIEEIGED